MSPNTAEAAATLDDIEKIGRRVRQSLIYQNASLAMILWGVLAFAGYLVSHVAPTRALLAWDIIYVVGITGSLAMGIFDRFGARRRLDLRIFAAFLLFFAFGFFWSQGLAHFTPRQMSAFWPTYFMLAYILAGLWIGTALVVVGLVITLLTLVGYFWIGPWFDLWMAVVNGGGLVVGGVWMRRI